MPERDAYGRLGGFLEIEDQEYSDAWRRRYVLLDESSLKFYHGKETIQDSTSDAPSATIDLAYITKVAITTNKANADYCFEIHKASEKWYLKSSNESEIEEWFKALHKAAVNPIRDTNIERGSSVKLTSSNDSNDNTINTEAENICYETKIIGGVPVRTVKTTTGDQDSLPNSRSKSGTSEKIRPVKGGYCIKQGAVVKSWKRRYFKLDMFKFCYYERETDKEPRGSVSATDLRGARPHTGAFSYKQNVFEVETPQRIYYIQAESEYEMNEWIKAFKQVIRSIKGKSTVMSKLRASSDSPLSRPSDAYGSQASSTLPAQVSRDERCAEAFPTISASALLSMDVSHSGWVRKEGFAYRSWRSRFMVLHHGCIYYFKETDSNTPKGKFALNGYRCYPAPERADRYPYVFKIVPEDEKLRTYYISSPSKTEMEGWIKSITTDTQLYCQSEYDYVDTRSFGASSTTYPTLPKVAPPIQKREPAAGPDKVFSHSFPKSSAMMARPVSLLPPKLDRPDYGAEELDDDQEHYETVDARCFQDTDLYLDVLPNETDGSSSASTEQSLSKPPSYHNGRPAPQVRPKLPPRPPEMREDSESDDEDSDEDSPYLDSKFIRGQSPTSPKRNGPSLTSPERERPIPLPRSPEKTLNVTNSKDIDVTYLSVIGNKEFEDLKRESERTSQKQQTSPTPAPPPRPHPRPPRSSELIATDDKYLTPECFKPRMPKEQAKIFLELGRTVGVYIINASKTSDTRMSLSVWLGNGVKHYLIFKREEMFSLDPNELNEQFTGLRQLVEYYYSHPLPKSNQKLTAPFAS